MYQFLSRLRAIDRLTVPGGDSVRYEIGKDFDRAPRRAPICRERCWHSEEFRLFGDLRDPRIHVMVKRNKRQNSHY